MTVSFEQTITVAARSYYAFSLDVGQHVRFTDIEGAQPIDFWAFNRFDIYEHLSCEHTKPQIERVYPSLGDAAYTNHRHAVVTLVADNSPGQHDMQFAACDVHRYRELGWDTKKDGYHANCQDNLHAGLADLDLSLPYTPQPWNLFTNFFLFPDGTFEVKAPATKPGDNMTLRAEMDIYVVVSACPQDMNDTCGGAPGPIQVEIE
ncbi:MAG: urea carboxylase-associated family protein [Pseudomonadota bacterium]